jgi:hypothetical protein
LNVREGTLSALESFGVDVVFQAHSHAYERFKYSFTETSGPENVHDSFGVQYVVTGGAGMLPDRVRLSDPSPGVAGRQRGLATYNACILTADGSTSLELRAYELGGPGPLDVLTLTQKYPHPRKTLVGKYEVPASSTYRWKYFQAGAPPSDWNVLYFNDSSWSEAGVGGELGFGDGDEATPLAAGQTSYYFRRRFTVQTGDIALGDVVELRLVVDDGCDVYLATPQNPVPSAPERSVPVASQIGHKERQWRFLRVGSLTSSSLAGDYVLAVKMTQQDAPGETTDLSFWAELVVKTPSS